MKSDITVIIPTISGREELLIRALRSVDMQLLSPDEVIVQADSDHEGAAVTRNKALANVMTKYIAFLDDDDELYPQHLALLHERLIITNADLCYPWFDLFVMNELRNDQDPLSINGDTPFGLPFDDIAREYILTKGNFIPVTVSAKTEAVLKAGGFTPHPQASTVPCEDWGLWAKMLDNGAAFIHLPVRTWRWNHHGNNTGGQQ